MYITIYFYIFITIFITLYYIFYVFICLISDLLLHHIKAKEQRSNIIDQTDKFRKHLLEEIKLLREELKVNNYFIKTLLLLKQLNHDERF